MLVGAAVIAGGAGERLVAAADAEARPRVHVVEAGDDLWTIAREHDCQVDDVLEANHLGSDAIHPGDELAIPRCDIGPLHGPPPPAEVVVAGEGDGDAPLVVRHEVAPGESLFTIARDHDTTVGQIQVQNGLSDALIHAGDELYVIPGAGRTARVVPGQSLGTPQAGRLARGVQLPQGPGYYRRRPHYAWGTNHAVGHTRNVLRAVRARYPGLHRLAIGDFSAEEGGPIPRHTSHQSGRDADIGLFFRSKPNGYPESFTAARRDNLHFEATFSLLESFAATEDLPGGVEVMFLNYEVQRMLYEWARREGGVPRDRLRDLFQYPRGTGDRTALIRHEPGHRGHVHVRFRCPEGDSDCR